jgi:mannose-1-phosphate guanylyltransferase/mannose-6-phosphate isomerase
MIAVIIAGGSGTRLWPLSTGNYPKHLLAVNGDAQSLLQKTYARASSVADTVYVITEQSHAHHVQEQLSGLPADHLLIEPDRRGTANCMLVALITIKQKHDPNEPIFILWSDHYIRDIEGFKHSITVAGDTAVREKRIVLIGIEPDYPATSFGYIEKGSVFDVENFVCNVSSFKEKPDFTTAKKYFKTGNFLWNCGYFIATLSTFEEHMSHYAPKLLADYQSLQVAKDEEEFTKRYLQLNPSNIDNALIEKVDDLLVVPASFDWIDLGSYSDLHKVTDRDENENHITGANVTVEGVENSFIQNHEDKPVAVIGLDNVVVVNTKDGILVSRKDLSQKIGEVSKRIQKKEN